MLRFLLELNTTPKGRSQDLNLHFLIPNQGLIP